MWEGPSLVRTGHAACSAVPTHVHVTPAGSTGSADAAPPPDASPAVTAAMAGGLSSAEASELVHLRGEVRRLCRENKTLRLENDNLAWLVDEVKRLRAVEKQAQAASGTGARGP